MEELEAIHEHLPGDHRAVILVHGLNNNVSILAPMRDFFLKYGFTVINVNLAGHRPTCKNWHSATYPNWKKEIEAAVELAKKDCEEIYFCCFSLGSVLALDYHHSHPQVFKGGVLFSSPVYVHKWSEKAHGIFPKKLIVPFPTAIPGHIMAKRISSTRAYTGLFEAIKAAQSGRIEDFLFIADPRDKLIDWKRLREKFPDNEFLEVECHSHFAKHVTSMPQYVREEDWKNIIGAVTRYLKLEDSERV